MSGIKTGGPAFPWTQDRADRGDIPGMTLRDYFAAKAMQGSLSNADDVNSMARFAEWCYEMADAMLAAREKGGAA